MELFYNFLNKNGLAGGAINRVLWPPGSRQIRRIILANNGNTTKEQEREELHRALWQIANGRRGIVDGWDFKQYVLGMHFYRFISENLTSYINQDFDYSPAGVLAPKSKADLAFTMHILLWISTIGTAAIVEFPGVLYRGGAEQNIRKYLVDNNYIDTVIQLPPDLFFGTTIATCIIVLKKSTKDIKTLFIDTSAEFVRGGNKNKLSEEKRARFWGRLPNARTKGISPDWLATNPLQKMTKTSRYPPM